MENLPALIVIVPLMGAVLCPIICYFNRNIGKWLTTCAMTASLMMSIIQLKQIIKNGEIHYWFGNWKPPYGIEFALDSLNGVIVVLICIMGLISTIYSMPFFDGFSRFKTAGYYSILSLLVTGLLGMSSTGDVFNLYVFLDKESWVIWR